MMMMVMMMPAVTIKFFILLLESHVDRTNQITSPPMIGRTKNKEEKEEKSIIN